MLKNLLIIFCFHIPLLYGQNDSNEVGVRTVLDTPVIISLNRCIEKYEETLRLMQQAGFTNISRFEAIDGYSTDEEYFKELNIHKTTPGYKGCTASHLLLWKKFLKDYPDREFLFICEDDMLPHTHFSTLFPLYWKATPKDFDILMVGGEFMKKINKKQNKNLIITTPTQNTHAYIISKNGAQKLLNLYKNIHKDSKEVDFNIDVFIRQMMEKGNIVYYCCNGVKFPDITNQGKIWEGRDSGICFQNTTFDSTIYHGDNATKLALNGQGFQKYSSKPYIDLSSLGSEELEQLLINSLRNKKVAYCANRGNAGDALIWYGTICLFKKLGISYFPYASAVEYGLLPTVDSVVFGGGGNFVPYYSECSKFLEKTMSLGKPILLLPHTVQGNQNFLARLLPNVVIICREQMSYDYCKRIVPFKENIYLGCDLAFFADIFSFIELKEESIPPKIFLHFVWMLK